MKELDLKSAKSAKTHLILENIYKSNLVTDFSSVDYTKDSLGMTRLKETECLPTFIDELFIYGYLAKHEVVQNGKGKDEASSRIVCRIQNDTKAEFDGTFCPQKIIATSGIESNGEICRTIQMLEMRNKHRALKGWKKYHGEQADEPVAVFRYKVDVSELSIEYFISKLPGLETRLNTRGFSLYSIDYTQDFSGVLDRDALEKHFLSIGFVH